MLTEDRKQEEISSRQSFVKQHWKFILFLTMIIISVGLFTTSMLGFNHHFYGLTPKKPYQPLSMHTQDRWFEKKSRKVVFFLVDALRFNMVQYQTSEQLTDDPMKNRFYNNFKSVYEKMRSEPQNQMLFLKKTLAPAFTDEKIMELMTGLYGFICGTGNHLQPNRIVEDSLLNQGFLNGKKIFYSGESIWRKLFAHNITDINDMGSFNLNDITSDIQAVDLAIDAFANENKNLDMFFLHLQNLDHVYHRDNSAYNPEAIDILQRINLQIQNFLNVLQDDDIFVLISDHGISDKGAHGSGTDINELQSVFWAYSKQGFLGNRVRQEAKAAENQCWKNLANVMKWDQDYDKGSIMDVDVGVTISSLQGIPVSFANLGQIIFDVYPAWNDRSCDDILREVHSDMFMNYQQSNYFVDYIKDNSKVIESNFQQKYFSIDEYTNIYRDAMNVKTLTQNQILDSILRMRTKIEKLSDEMKFVKPMNTKLMLFATFLFFSVVSVSLILLFLNFPQIFRLIRNSIQENKVFLGFFTVITVQYLFGYDLVNGWSECSMNEIYAIGFYLFEFFVAMLLLIPDRRNKLTTVLLFLMTMSLVIIQKNLMKKDIFDLFLNLRIRTDLNHYQTLVVTLPALAIAYAFYRSTEVFSGDEKRRLQYFIGSIYFDLLAVSGLYVSQNKVFKVHTAKILYLSFIAFHVLFYRMRQQGQLKLSANKLSLIYLLKFVPFCALQWHDFKSLFFITAFCLQFFAMYRAAYAAKVHNSLGFYFLQCSFHVLFWHLTGRGFTLNDLDMNSAFLMLQTYNFLAGSLQVLFTTIIPFIFFYFVHKNLARIFRHYQRKNADKPFSVKNFQLCLYLEDDYEDFLQEIGSRIKIALFYFMFYLNFLIYATYSCINIKNKYQDAQESADQMMPLSAVFVTMFLFISFDLLNIFLFSKKEFLLLFEEKQIELNQSSNQI